MVKPILILSACLIHLHCVNREQAFNVKGIASKQVATAPILWTADYSPDGKYLAVGGNDNLLRLYAVNSLKLLHSFKLPATVQFVDWHNDSKLLAIALADKPVQILDMTTLRFQHLNGSTGSRALDWNYDERYW